MLTGGSTQVTLTEAQLAVHQHGITSNGLMNILLVVVRQLIVVTHSHGGGTSRQDRNHVHNGSTSPGGNHVHPPVGQVGFDNEGNGHPLRILAEDGPPYNGMVWDTTGGEHGHNFTTAGINQDHAILLLLIIITPYTSC